MRCTIVLATTLLLIGSALNAQILKPVKWSFGAKKISATEALVFFKATIDDGWHVYSQYVKEGGPIPTSFKFEKSPDYLPVGKTAGPKPIVRMELTFNMKVGFYEKSVIFQQKIKLKKGQVTVQGSINYMTCNDKQCLPPENVKFNIPIN
jgi:cytochrome c biogenesis DsbD-like protein